MRPSDERRPGFLRSRRLGVHPSVCAALAAVLLVACSSVPARAPLEDTPPVRDVDIDGAEQIEEEDILRQLATRAPAPWPWSDPLRFDPVRWDLDLRRIERVYEAEGYYGTRVVDAEVRRKEDGVHLRATVDEAPPTIVRHVRIDGAGALPPEVALEVLREVRVREGERFREEDWKRTKQDVGEALGERGYAAAEIDGDVQVHLAEHAADVSLRIAPGRVYRFGEIVVAGEPSGTMPSGPVLVTARAALPEGKRYSLKALSVAQERIFALGGFSAVAVSAAAPVPGSDAIPILVEVRDAPRYAVQLGAGIAADPSRQEVRAVAEGVDRNFLGSLRVLQARASAGAAFAPTVWGAFEGAGPGERWGPLASLVIDFGQPIAFGKPGLELFAAAEGETAPREGWDEASVRSEAGVIWRLGRRATIQASYALERWWLFDTPLRGGGAPITAFGCAGSCTLSYLEQRLILDWRDSPRDTKRGQLVRVLARELAGPIGSSFEGVQLVGEGRVFVPVWRASRTVLAGRLRLGTAFGEGPPPVMLRFFSGGNDMRGFGTRRLSPRLQVGPGTASSLPVGGASVVDGSLEVRWSTGTPVSLVGFTDFGAVTAERFDFARLGDALQLAVGGGVRWRTRVAPIRFDFAVLMPVGGPLATYDLAGNRTPAASNGGCFGLWPGRVGDPEARCAVHIWIGEAF